MIAETLGTPLIPWQRQVLEVATEMRPDGSYEYQVVVVSVPRQCGKTSLLRALAVYRTMVLNRDVFYTAQTGKDARARWMDLVNILRVHPALKAKARFALRGGSEHIYWTHNQAKFQVFAPTPESLHGYTPPTVLVDEVFHLTGPAGELLMGAIGPAQFVVVDKQIWLVSTMGTEESRFLHDWIDRAIEGTPRVAGFIWGAREDQDPFDLDDITDFHPGVGQRLNGKLVTAADVLAEADRNSRAEYERAFANRRTATQSHLIPLEPWRALTHEDMQPPADHVPLWLAYDVAAGARRGAILAGWRDPDTSRTLIRPVRLDEGVGWMPAALDELAQQLRPRAIRCAGSGPVLEVTAKVTNLRHAGALLEVATEREYAAASGAFLTMIEEHSIGHPDDDLLNRSVVGLVTRTSSGDGLAFSRRHSVGDSSPGIAAALVADRVANEPVHDIKPTAYFYEGAS